MVKRWLIRCLCLLPLTLCGLGWVWSESHGANVRYVYAQRTGCVRGGTSSGRVLLIWEQGDALRSNPRGLSHGSWRRDAMDDVTLPGEMAWLGFRIWRYEGSTYYTARRVDVPYWFLLLLSALFLLLAWCATRPRPQPQGFPVELAKKETA